MFLLFEVAGEFRTIADTPENRAIVLRSWAIDRVYRLQIDLQTLRSGWPQNGDDELDGSLNLRAHEERLIRQALRQHETRRQAAAALGISHSTLQAKVKKMDGDGNGKAGNRSHEVAAERRLKRGKEPTPLSPPLEGRRAGTGTDNDKESR